MSLLFYELSQSLNIELRPIERSRKEIKKYLKENLNLDYEKIIEISKIDLSLNDLKGDLHNYSFLFLNSHKSFCMLLLIF